MIKIFKLAWSDSIFLFSFLFAVAFLIIAILARETNNRDIFLGLSSTFGSGAFIKFIEIFSLYRRYRKFEGKYSPFSYINSSSPSHPDYSQLQNESNGMAYLEYKGGHLFALTLTNTGEVFKWKGRLEFNSYDVASISWRYISPASLNSVAGHKKAVIFEEFNPLRIHMFSDDNQGYGREVLIKADL